MTTTRPTRPPFSLSVDSDHHRLIGTGYTALSYAKSAAEAARLAAVVAGRHPQAAEVERLARVAHDHARDAAEAALDALGPVVNADGDPEDPETARLHCAAVLTSARAADDALAAARRAAGETVR